MDNTAPMTQADALAWALGKIESQRPTLKNWCGYNAAGIRIKVIYPYQGQFAVANYTYGGYPVLFKTLADAKRHCDLSPVARWEEEDVPQ